MNESRVVELHFPIRGTSLPCDHAYALYSAISSLIPIVHNANWLGIHTLKGRKIGDGSMSIGRSAKLKVRLPADRAPELFKLAGAKLDIASHNIQCGIPEFHILKPASRLRSRFVMIKCKASEGKTAEITSFLDSLKRQIDCLGVSTDARLERDIFPRGQDGLICRRVMRVKYTALTGYGVILDNLSERDSLIIQENGLGGKRRMGCGLFEPIGRVD